MTITPVTLDLSTKYRVDGYDGIAFRLLGWALAAEDPEPELVCGLIAHDHDEFCYEAPDDEEVTESDTWVRMVMVGDDRVHDVEYAEIHPIGEDDYCKECGQIGCTHDGRNP